MDNSLSKLFLSLQKTKEIAIPHMKRIFDETDIPYNILSQYGLSQQMIDDLPEQAMDSLLGGSMTPLLPMVGKDKNGKTIKRKAAIALVRTDDGINVILSTPWKENSLEGYTEEQQHELRAGKVLLINEQEDKSFYVQLDDITNKVMTSPAETIQHNILIYKEKIGWDDLTADNIMLGKVVTFHSGSQFVTYGVDLHSNTGIRAVAGTTVDWEEKKNKLPIHGFGIYGCWVSDGNNSFKEYIPEENYTEEMNREFEQVGEDNAKKAERVNPHFGY